MYGMIRFTSSFKCETCALPLPFQLNTQQTRKDTKREKRVSPSTHLYITGAYMCHSLSQNAIYKVVLCVSVCLVYRECLEGQKGLIILISSSCYSPSIPFQNTWMDKYRLQSADYRHSSPLFSRLSSHIDDLKGKSCFGREKSRIKAQYAYVFLRRYSPSFSLILF